MKLKAILASVIIALNCFVFPNVYAGNEDIKLIDNKKIDNKKIKDYKISLCLWSLIGIPYFYIKSVKYIEEKKRKKINVVIIGDTKEKRRMFLSDIKRNSYNIFDEISHKYAKYSKTLNYTEISDWNITEVEYNYENSISIINLGDSLKHANIIIVLVSDRDEAEKIDSIIYRTTGTERYECGYVKSRCLVVCVADESSEQVQKEIEKNREIGRKKGCLGSHFDFAVDRYVEHKCILKFLNETYPSDLEIFAHQLGLEIQKGTLLNSEMTYIWEPYGRIYYNNNFNYTL